MPDEPGLTELTKHLRTVHFTLILACILFFLSAYAERRSEVSLAHIQLQKILKISNSWSRWTQKFSFEQLRWLREQKVRWLAQEPEPFYINSATLTNQGIHQSPGTSIGINLVGAPLYFYLGDEIILAVPNGELNVADVFPLEMSFPANDAGSTTFKNLKSFRGFWNNAATPMANLLTYIDDNVYVIINGTIKGQYKLIEKSHDSKMQGFYKGEFKSQVFKECPEVNFQVITQLEGNKEFNEFYCTKIENGGVVIPAKVRNTRLPTDLQQWLIKEFDLEGSGGDFPDMFPQLDRVTSDFQELDTHKIDKIMRAELARQSERIQFLGLSFPEQLITSWGAVIVFAIQVYFYLHLQTFNRSSSLNISDSLRYTGWIGIYSDWRAIAVSILTVSFFPTLVSVYTVYKNSWWGSVSLLVIVLVLSLDSMRLLYRINNDYCQKFFKRCLDGISNVTSTFRRRPE